MTPQPQNPPWSVSKALIALSCVAAFFIATTAAVVPELHCWLHKDAAQLEHECAITLLEAGVSAADAPTTVAASQAAVESSEGTPLQPVWVPSIFSRACIFAHAPPARS